MRRLAFTLVVLVSLVSSAHAGVHVVGLGGVHRLSTTNGVTWNAPQTIDAAVSEFGTWFVDDNVGIAVGNGNSIQRTGNGGTTWSPITSPITTVYDDVMFPTVSIGYIACANGQVLKSTNGGLDWSAQSPGGGGGLTGIFFLNANTGWAVGTGGSVVRTTNGGSSWSPTTVSPAQDLDDVFFIDANTGWAVGKNGAIFKSTNGGGAWTPQTSGAGTTELESVWFTSATTGFVCGGDRLLLRTTNGGTNWNPVTLPSTNQQSGLHDVTFAGPDSGVVVGSGVNAFSTVDGGANWTVANPDPSASEVWQAVSMTRPPGPPPNVTITITSVPAGRAVNFDGAANTTPFTKTFPSGESHTLASPTPQAGAVGTQFAFSQWSGGSTSSSASITVSPTTSTTFTANFTTQFQLTMTNVANGSTTPAEGTSFRNAGTTVNISASPAAGYSFGSWTGTGTGSFTGTGSAHTITMNAPITETAAFTVNTITTTITTSPAGKQVRVNGALHTAPFTLTQNANLAIALDVPSPQEATATQRLAFVSWSDAGAQAHSVSPSTSQTFTVTLQTEYFLDTGSGAGTGTMTPADGWFPAGAHLTTAVQPAAGFFFYLLADGGTTALSLNGRYAFDMTGPTTLRANFSNAAERSVMVSSTPPGREFKVVGLSFTSAQSFSWPNGLILPLAAVTPQGTSSKRWIFDHWSDNGAASHNATPTSAIANNYAVTYQTQFPLTMATTGGTGTTTPAAGITWEDSLAQVQISATPGSGFRFVQWTGAGANSYTGTQNVRNVTIVNPVTETATFELTPFLKLTAPAVAAKLVAGEPVSITWNTNVAGNVQIEWRNGPAGVSNTIIASTPNDGQFTWTPPDMPMNTLYLRVADAADQDPVDLVGPFTLCDPYFNPAAQPTASLSTAAQQLAVGDYDENGVLDLIVPNAAGFNLMKGAGAGGVGDGGFFAGTLTQLLAFNRAVEALDVNEDGRLDVVSGLDDGRIAISKGNGTGAVGNGTFAATVFVNAGGSLRDLEPGDFNEDGRTDLVAADSTGSQLVLLAGGGAGGIANGSFTSVGTVAIGALPRVVKSADLDGDGILDLVVGTKGAAANDLVLLRGQGAGAVGDFTFASAGTIGTNGDVTDLLLRDLDDDGKIDLAWIDDTNHLLRLARNTGPFTFAAPTSLALTKGARALVATDFDHDGRLDLAVCETEIPRVRVFAGGGSGTTNDGTFALLTTIPSTDAGPSALVTEDFLEDNRPDFVLSATTGSAVNTRAWTGDLAFCTPANESITMLEPVAGGTWNTGQELLMTWNSNGRIDAVDLEITRDDGVKWETIARGVPGNSFRWTVTPPASNTCRFRVADSALRNRNGISDATFAITNTVDVPPAPLVAALAQARPNPSTGSVRFDLALPRAQRVSVVLYDLAGRIVRRLVDGPLEAGVHSVTWDGRNEAGAEAPGGVYFARARWSGFEAERRIVRLR